MAESDDEDFAALFAASEGKRPRERRVAAGDVVRGRVIAVGATAAFVAVGDKAEATIELGEFRDPATGEVQLHEGDEIEATVVDDGSRSGSIVLKRVAGRGGHVPGELEQAFAHGVAIEGLVTGENKGGYDVQLGAVRAFCPGSQIDRRRTEGAQYVGQRLRFRITKLDPRGRNVVVSRRPRLEEEAAAQQSATCAGARRGARGSAHPRQAVSIGESVDVTIVEIDPAKRRIGLSMVETAKRAKDAAELEERRETEAHLAKDGEAQSLGTFAELLARTRRER